MPRKEQLAQSQSYNISETPSPREMGFFVAGLEARETNDNDNEDGRG